MKYLTGKVVSEKMPQTVVVKVEHATRHPKYHKRITTSKKYHAHNTLGAKEGNVVKIEQSRPVSKTKKFKVTEIVSN